MPTVTVFLLMSFEDPLLFSQPIMPPVPIPSVPRTSCENLALCKSLTCFLTYFNDLINRLFALINWCVK